MNFVQVRFQDSNGCQSPKAYTYRNRCDLHVGDYAMVDVGGLKKIVKVEKVCEDLPSDFRFAGELKWIEGAVYLDETLQKLREARARINELREKSREKARRMAETYQGISFLDKSEIVEFNKLNKFLEENK